MRVEVKFYTRLIFSSRVIINLMVNFIIFVNINYYAIMVMVTLLTTKIGIGGILILKKL